MTELGDRITQIVRDGLDRYEDHQSTRAGTAAHITRQVLELLGLDKPEVDFLVQSRHRDAQGYVLVHWGPLRIILASPAATVAATEIHKAAIVAEHDARIVTTMQNAGLTHQEIDAFLHDLGEWVVGDTT